MDTVVGLILVMEFWWNVYLEFSYRLYSHWVCLLVIVG